MYLYNKLAFFPPAFVFLVFPQFEWRAAIQQIHAGTPGILQQGTAAAHRTDASGLEVP